MLLPIALFVVPYGVAFGVASVERSVPVVLSVTMSALVFSGAAQFASLEFWKDPIVFLSLFLVMIAINARHIIMGAALSPWINSLPLSQRVLSLLLLSDPNFTASKSAFTSGDLDAGHLLGGGLILWAGWVTGTLIGAVAGSGIGDMKTYGLDIVMACFFAASITDRLRSIAILSPVLVAFLIGLVTAPLLPAGWNVILAALLGGVWSLLFHAR